MNRLGRYEVHSLLGTGGMGKVYRAVLHGPAGFRKPVALKVLDGDSSGVTREARLGGLLRHRNLVEVYDVGEHEGTWYCAMELVEGGSLRRRGRLPPRAVVEVGLQVCAGLGHAWQEVGLVHLDLKPANLLVAAGTVKVADLGIAQARGFDGRGGVRGTRGYMSPEQARGDQVDPRSDIFSLGVLLHELATGRKPVQGSDHTWSTTAPADDLPGVELDLTDAAWLAPVVERCIAAEREERFEDWEGLAAALRALSVEGPGLDEALGGTATRAAATSSSVERRRPSSNLGAPVDRFVGRERDLAGLAQELESPGLLTLRGAGGMGKTRLAREAARQWHGSGSGEAWFCDLREARTAADLLHGVAAVLQVPVSRGDLDAVAQQLGNALRSRGPAVLVLDNLEQLAGQVRVLSGWVARAPALRVLATSRRNLGLVGERLWELHPLHPEDAVALIRARAADRGRPLPDHEDLLPLAEALEGIPLALELCASRLRMMSPSQILSRLDQRLRLLGDGDGRTLRGTVEWSWELLDPIERAAAEQLAVFVGGIDFEAAEAVLELPEGAPWVLDVLESLLEQSILTEQNGQESARLGMFEAIRAYALERAEPEARRAAEQRHGAWFARQGGVQALASLHEHGGEARRRSLEREIANLAVACRRAVARDDGPTAVRTVAAAWEVYHLRGPLQSAADLAAEVIAMPGLGPGERAMAGRVAGESAVNAGRPAAAADLYETALAQAESVGDERLAAWIRGNLGAAAWRMGDLDRAGALYREALEAHRAAGRERFVASLMGNLGALAWQRGALDQAAEHYTEAVVRARTCGDRLSEAISLQNLAVLYSATGRPAQAVDVLEQALPLIRRLGDRKSEGIALGNLGNALRELGERQRAEQAYDAALEAHRAVGNLLSEAVLLGNRGDMVSREDGDHEAGQRWLAQALDLSRRAEDLVWEGIHLGALGRVLARAGRIEEARAHLERAVEMVAGRHARAHADFTQALEELAPA